MSAILRLRLSVLAIAFVVLVADAHWAGWSWPVSILTGMFLVFVGLAVGGRIRLYLDVRRGLAPREWRALCAMASQARRGIRVDFDKVSLRRTSGVDAGNLTGYATIALNIVIARELGSRPTPKGIDHLAVHHATKWGQLVQREPTILVHLVRAACRYQSDGFPVASWDNYRGLAAAIGVMSGRVPYWQSRRRQVSSLYLGQTAQSAMNLE